MVDLTRQEYNEEPKTKKIMFDFQSFSRQKRPVVMSRVHAENRLHKNLLK